MQYFVYAALTGSPWLYTLIQCWSVWQCFLGCICTSAAGALGYDCLPSDELGRPLAASRDTNLMAYASSIPRTGLPMLLGGSFLWFPDHYLAFRTFFVVGGILGLGSLVILIFLVHPKDEPLDKSFQGRWRARYHSEYDALRRQGKAGPEKLVRNNNKKNPIIALPGYSGLKWWRQRRTLHSEFLTVLLASRHSRIRRRRQRG
eukprot:SAG31_NODE_4101_length_3583_cov_1.895522_3_plen_203_part_00